MSFISENLYPDIHAEYKCEKILVKENSETQDLLLFENKTLGKILMLDGVTQVTTADEFVYHEMMTHVPIFSHADPKRLLIIGGGDGGIAREALRHQNLKKIVMVEIDPNVPEFSKKYLPEISNGAFENSRLDLRIDDGAAYVKNTTEKFDIIIVDSTDPIGPGAVLFTREFYADCKKILAADGILVTQNGVPFMQADELKSSVGFFREIFRYGTCFRATVPTYAFGEMAMGWASEKDYRNLTLENLQTKFAELEGETGYYTPAVHLAAFALPAYIEKILNF